jgi:hypothetical protein
MGSGSADAEEAEIFETTGSSFQRKVGHDLPDHTRELEAMPGESGRDRNLRTTWMQVDNKVGPHSRSILSGSTLWFK